MALSRSLLASRKEEIHTPMDLIHNLNNDITTHSRLAESTMLCLPRATHSCLAENTMLHLHRVLTIRAEVSLPKCAFKWLGCPGAF